MKHNVDININDSDIIEYIRDNYDVDDVFTEEDIKNYISRQFMPEDAFDESSLTLWAADHGFVKG
jgi:hypothetical protein